MMDSQSVSSARQPIRATTTAPNGSEAGSGDLFAGLLAALFTTTSPLPRSVARTGATDTSASGLPGLAGLPIAPEAGAGNAVAVPSTPAGAGPSIMQPPTAAGTREEGPEGPPGTNVGSPTGQAPDPVPTLPIAPAIDRAGTTARPDEIARSAGAGATVLPRDGSPGVGPDPRGVEPVAIGSASAEPVQVEGDRSTEPSSMSKATMAPTPDAAEHGTPEGASLPNEAPAPPRTVFDQRSARQQERSDVVTDPVENGVRVTGSNVEDADDTGAQTADVAPMTRNEDHRTRRSVVETGTMPNPQSWADARAIRPEVARSGDATRKASNTAGEPVAAIEAGSDQADDRASAPAATSERPTPVDGRNGIAVGRSQLHRSEVPSSDTPSIAISGDEPLVIGLDGDAAPVHAREIEEIVQPVRTGENGRAAAQPVVAQVAAHLASGVDQRLERIHLRLHPEELGGVDVELRFDADRSVNVSISVEKPETYELLQRESRHLTRLLQESGVDLRNDIDLSMQRQDGGQHGARQQGWNGDGRNARDDASPVPSSRAAPTPSSAAPLPGRSGNRLFDLRI